jgi:hypothetical protein
MVLIEHARDTVAAAAKMVHNDAEPYREPYRKMFEASMSLLGVVGALNREMEDRATDQVIGKAIKKKASRE